jgi:hypothetical protein
LPGIVNAQTSPDSITKVVLQKDSLFWTAYNNCEIDCMMQYVTDNVIHCHPELDIFNSYFTVKPLKAAVINLSYMTGIQATNIIIHQG